MRPRLTRRANGFATAAAARRLDKRLACGAGLSGREMSQGFKEGTMDLLAIAKSAADRVEAASVEKKVPTAVCVVDVHGNIVLQHRMAGAPVFSIELSERKAYTSALVGLRTLDILPLVQPGQPLYPLSTVASGRFCAMGGGVPLIRDGQVVAGVGVSGGTVEQDVAIVEAAVG